MPTLHAQFQRRDLSRISDTLTAVGFEHTYTYSESPGPAMTGKGWVLWCAYTRFLLRIKGKEKGSWLYKHIKDKEGGIIEEIKAVLREHTVPESSDSVLQDFHYILDLLFDYGVKSAQTKQEHAAQFEQHTLDTCYINECLSIDYYMGRKSYYKFKVHGIVKDTHIVEFTLEEPEEVLMTIIKFAVVMSNYNLELNKAAGL